MTVQRSPGYAAAIVDRYIQIPSALSEQFDDVTVVLDHKTGNIVTLNAAAACVWNAVTSPSTLEDVGTALVDRFGISEEQARSDGLAALTDLEHRSLIARRPA